MIRPGHDMTVGQLFAANAHYFPNEPAVVLADETRTHAELYRRGCRFASAVAELGLRKQDRIAIISTNNIEFIETYVGAWSSGFVVATVNFRLALAEWLYILNDLAPRMLVIEAQYIEHLPALRAGVSAIEHVVVIGGEAGDAHSFAALIDGAPSDAPPFTPGEDDIAALMYTSGTTGRPKGCIMGQREVAFNPQLLCQVQGNLNGDRFLCVMPLFHIGGMAIGMSVLAKGGTVIVHRQFDPAAVIDALERDRITMVLMAPTMVQMVLDHPSIAGRDFSALRMIVYSAAPMPTTVLRRGIAVFGNVFVQMLGSTEGVSITYLPQAMHRPDGTPEEQAKLLSVGIPFPNVALRVVDEEGRDRPVGEPGEVILRGPTMFRGYWNNTIATIESLRDGWYYSGDVGRFDDEGYLYLVDRKKDMIISGGENIYSREVEEAVLTHPAVSEVAVIGRPDETWGETVCAVVVAMPGATVTEAEIIEHSRGRIASYKKPRDVVFVSALPKLVSGKVDKKVLRDQHGRPAA